MVHRRSKRSPDGIRELPCRKIERIKQMASPDSQETVPQEIFRAKVNLETSRIAWKELQRFFASGVAVAVDAELDLVEVAFQFSKDNKAQVERWLITKKVSSIIYQLSQSCKSF